MKGSGMNVPIPISIALTLVLALQAVAQDVTPSMAPLEEYDGPSRGGLSLAEYGAAGIYF